jgi:hypothetical protein
VVSAAHEVPRRGGIKALREAAATCTACPLYANAVVKHFKFKPRGKRRIHQTPSRLEVDVHALAGVRAEDGAP